MTVAPRPSSRPRWWQWPTVLSLDAPAVALAWQALVAEQVGVRLGAAPRLVLGASVWLAYSVDRWIEGWRLHPAQVQTQRHAFYQRQRWPLAVLWVGLLGVDLGVACGGLERVQFWAGACVLPLVGAYLFSHQFIHRHHPGRLPKEICVAGLLAVGIGVFILPLLPPGHGGRLTWPLALFALLAFANCALISAWEHGVDRAQGQTSLAHQFRGGHALARAAAAAALLAGLAAALALPSFRASGKAAALAGLFLWIIDRSEPRLGRRAARVLADAALLTPLLWL